MAESGITGAKKLTQKKPAQKKPAQLAAIPGRWQIKKERKANIMLMDIAAGICFLIMGAVMVGMAMLKNKPPKKDDDDWK